MALTVVRKSAQGIEDKTNRAFKDTAQTYLDRAGIKLDLQQVESTLRKKRWLQPRSRRPQDLS